jgi:N-acetylglucosaminyldiphosphoundecaprenol N-acetyl-beta-D-mannosaminyltransferase
MRPPDVPCANLLGVQVSTLRFSKTIDLVAQTIAFNQKLSVSPSPVYTIMQGYERPEVRAALNANLVTPDGMPVVWALRLLGHSAERVYGPDVMYAVCERSVKEGWRHFFYGGAEGVPEMLATALQKKFPGLQVAGLESPPFRTLTPDEDAAMVERLNKCEAQIVWVGLGSPKQDVWMFEHRSQLNAPVLIAVGAAFDFYAGRVRQAPRWMQRSGLEWLFRLGSEPGRLWRRYLLYNPKFVFNVILQVSRLKAY